MNAFEQGYTDTFVKVAKLHPIAAAKAFWRALRGVKPAPAMPAGQWGGGRKLKLTRRQMRNAGFPDRSAAPPVASRGAKPEQPRSPDSAQAQVQNPEIDMTASAAKPGVGIPTVAPVQGTKGTGWFPAAALGTGVGAVAGMYGSDYLRRNKSVDDNQPIQMYGGDPYEQTGMYSGV